MPARKKKTKKVKNVKSITSSEIVQDSEQRQYHIGLAPGDVANTILIVGDPERAKKVSAYFDTGSITTQVQSREFLTFTGTYKKQPISVIATGIGPSNIEILMIELSLILSSEKQRFSPVIIRVGSSGGLQEYMNIGELVISTGAVRLEDTSLYFVDQSYPSIANYEVVTALVTAAEKEKVTYYTGLTASASGFYGAQGRSIPNFPVKDSTYPEKLKDRQVMNFEMESSTLFTLATLAGIRAGTVCAIYANRHKKEFIDPETKIKAEKDAIRCGLEAAILINKMDEVKLKNKVSNWNAGLHIV